MIQIQCHMILFSYERENKRNEKMKSLLKILSILCLFVSFISCDTPANCTYEDIEGNWKFFTSQKRNSFSEIDCKDYTGSFEGSAAFKLSYPNVAVDQFGNVGYWTLIYNQGFEVVVQGQKYFAFSKYKGDGDNATSICDQTMTGWAHNVLGRDWACFHGEKQSAAIIKRNKASPRRVNMNMMHKPNQEFVDSINKVQKLWKATLYTEHEGKTRGDLYKMAGGKASKIQQQPKAAPVTHEQKKFTSSLPKPFDWRNVDGVNYVSPIRNQGGCGSCYAFASMGMAEARLRIVTNNTKQLVFSPQDIVECSKYSQGCEGGFPYLIGGKYAEDFGLVEESCNPYLGADGSCKTKQDCQRHYFTGYKYVGGYYGACNSEAMKMALYNNGPTAIGFLVTNDFFHYKGGIYQNTNLQDHFNPFEITNHAVLLVGWGEEKGVPYWIVKNSWGESWGESGYFRIIRGVDEVGIESMAVESFPIL